MSYFDDASLVMIPSGYKDQKVYSVKPIDGSGDLTFSRASNATRVNSSGLVEKVRTNELTYSQDFTNPAWIKSNVSVTGGQADPNGGTTAALVQTTTAVSASFYRAQSGAKCFSIYAKAGTRTIFSIINGLYNNGAGFNLSTQTATTAGAGSLAKIESVGNGWYRCSVYMSSASEMLVVLSDVSGGGMTVGDNLYFAFAQAETGDIATDYIATTSTAVSVGPVSGLPRLDYSGGASCPSLLLEPQRTNLFLQSEAIDNAAWGAARYTRTANQTASPSGYIDADLCTPTATSGTHEIFPVTGISFTATAHTMSLFAKYDGYNISLGVAGASINWTGCVFDLQNGIAKTPQSAGSQSVCTAKIKDYGSGWYRCSITFTPYTTPTFYPTFGAVNSANATLGAWGAQDFTADGTSGTYLWGAQLEAGAYATSYIPTLSTAVTRVQETAVKTGISSLIGASAGVVYFEGTIEGEGASTRRLISISDGTNANYLLVYNPFGTRGLDFVTAIGGAVQCNITSSSNIFEYGQRFKMAFAYAQDDFAFYINGTQIGIDGSGNIPSGLDRIVFGRGDQNANVFFEGNVSQALLFKTRLSNADLATLTTL